MLIIGLTGSIGMGKSTAAERFRSHDIPVFDADAEVHRLYVKEAVPLIDAAFPGAVVDGKVDRARLGAQVVGDDAAMRRLEGLIHPLVRESQRAFLRQAYEDGKAMAVLEIPLLFETGGDGRVDVTIVVSANAREQRDRVLSRPGMTREKFEGILAQQMPDPEKRERADFVVDTSGPISETQRELDRLIASLRGREGTAIEAWVADVSE